IEESKDLTSLSLDELIENLKVYEMIIKKDSEIVKAKVERKSLALKARRESNDEECLTSGSEDEEYAMAMFQRSRDDKNSKSDRKCFRCGDPNHLIVECSKPPKDKNQIAFVGGSWSDSGEEDDKKVNNETCLVAQASIEDGKVIGRGIRKKGFYVMKLGNKPKDQICLATIDENSTLQHKRLGNANMHLIQSLSSKELVRNLPKLKFDQHFCDACKIRKQAHTSHKAKNIFSTTRCLELLHMDLFGPFAIQSYGGNRYTLLIVDDYSTYTWTRFVKDKTEAFFQFEIFESLNVTFDETPPPSKISPLVDDDLDEEEAIKVTEKKSLENDIMDETLEIDKVFNIKESRNHLLENVIGNLNQRTLRSQAQNQIDYYISHDRVMHPLALHYERKTRSDNGKKRPRELNASSSSTTVNHLSSSCELDDTIDENDDESFHSNSSSPSLNVSSSSNVVPRVLQNPPHKSHNLKTYLSKTINL
nr:retrovirus-related Pol polyprotein from transposon TNT 1-94 [Tanacetum cinerariifolium]